MSDLDQAMIDLAVRLHCIEKSGYSSLRDERNVVNAARDRIANLEAEVERLREALNSICHHYCTWYDTGSPNQNGSAEAYDLVTIARVGLAEVK